MVEGSMSGTGKGINGRVDDKVGKKELSKTANDILMQL
jgi:hypothetical protein